MAADNQIVLEAVAQVEAAQSRINAFVFGTRSETAKLSERRELVVEVAKAKRNVDVLATDLRKLRQVSTAPTEIQVRTAAAVQQVDTVLTKVKAVTPAVKEVGAGDPLAALNAQFGRAAKAVTDFTLRTTEGSKKFGEGFEGSSTRARIALEGLVREIRKAQAAGKPVPAEHVALVDKLEHAYRQASSAAAQFRQTQAAVRGEMSGGSAPAADALAGSLGRVGVALKAWIIAKVTQELRDFAASAFQASETLKGLSIALASVTGGPEKAAEAMAFARSEAERLGIPLELAVRQFTKMAAAAQGTALEGEGVREVFSAIAEKSVVLRLKQQELEGVFLAVSQIMSKGKVTAEELRGQLGERLPGAVPIFSRALQVSTKELDKLLEQGLIPASEGMLAFARQLREEADPEALGQAMQSATSQVNRFESALFEAKAALGEGFSGDVGELSSALVDMVRESKPVIGAVGAVAGVLTQLVTVVLRVGSAIHSQFQSVAAFLETGFLAVISGVVKGTLFAMEQLARVAGLDEFAAKMRTARTEVTRTLDDITLGMAEVAFDRGNAAADSLLRLAGAGREAAPATAAAAGHVKVLATESERAAAKINQAIAAILAYAEKLPATGKVQREEADKIVKEIDKQLKAIRQLPAAEEEAFQAREKKLVELRERFIQFTTAYEKEQDKQAKAAQRAADKEGKALKQREQQLEAFLVRVKELGDEAIAASNGGAADLQRQIGEAQGELGALNAKPVMEVEDLQRADELQRKILELNTSLGDLGKAGKAAGSEAGAAAEQVASVSVTAAAEVKKAILEMVAGNREFAESFSQLGPDAQDQLQGLVQGFLATVEAQRLSRSELELFVTNFARIFEQANTLGEGLPTVGEGFVDRLKVLTGITTDSAKAFDVLRASAAGQAEQLAPIGPAASQAAAGLQEVVAAAPAASAAVAGSGEGYIRAHDAANGLTDANGRLVSVFESVENAATKSAAGLVVAGDQIYEVAKAGEGGTGGMIRFGDTIVEIGEKSEGAGEGLGSVAKGADKASDEIGKAGSGAKDAAVNLSSLRTEAGAGAEKLDKLAVAAERAADATATGAPNLEKLATAATAAVQPVTGLVEQLARIPELGLDEIFGSSADSVSDLAEGGKKLQETLESLAEFATEWAPILKQLGEAIKTVRAETKGLTVDLSAQVPVLKLVIELTKELAACQASLAAES